MVVQLELGSLDPGFSRGLPKRPVLTQLARGAGMQLGGPAMERAAVRIVAMLTRFSPVTPTATSPFAVAVYGLRQRRRTSAASG